MKIIPIILLILFGLAVQSFAQENGYQFTRFAGFELNTVNLSEIMKQYGKTELLETGEAGGYEARICYRLKNGILSFLSGEMGGPNLQLLGFGVSGQDPTGKCGNPPKDRSNLKLNIAGLQLRITKYEFEKLSSNKVEWEGNTGYIFFSS